MFQDEISCSNLLQNYIVKRSSRNTTIARPHQLSTTPKNTKTEKRKQCKIAANYTQNKTSKICFKCNKTVCGNCTATQHAECVICVTT